MTWNAHDHTPRVAPGATPRRPVADEEAPATALPSHTLHDQLLDDLWRPDASGHAWQQAAHAAGWITAQDWRGLRHLMTRGIVAQEVPDEPA